MEGYDSRQEAGNARHRRPESSLSGFSRLTPQSSNTSSANLPQRVHPARNDRERLAAQDGRSASLLQERIREAKAARMHDDLPGLDFDSLHDIKAVQSSPINHGSNGRLPRDKDALRPGSSGRTTGERLASKKGMGVKEMEETVSTLHKQNFDLKLELFHRRQRQTELEERLEAAEAQLSEQSEMQCLNEQLLAELEKRDQAVEEAVLIICALEEQVSELLDDRGVAQTPKPQHEKDYFHDFDGNGAGLDTPSSLPHFNRTATKYSQSAPVPKSLARMPSFLSDRSEGAEALRSLYLSPDPQGPNITGLPKLAESSQQNQMSEGDVMDSPRLSVLSESSFISVYGDKNLTVDNLNLDDSNSSPSPNDQRHRKSRSIEKWVEERVEKKPTPLRPAKIRGASFGANQFLSLNDVLESPLQRLEKLDRTLHRQNRKLTPTPHRRGPVASERRLGSEEYEKDGKNKDIRRTELETFGNQQTLPPTPDTISTSTLRHFKNSTDNLNRDTVDQALTLPLFGGVEKLSLYGDPSMRRPHSAGETITSRREGHGWDTVTQSEYTDAASDTDLEVPSSLDPWIHTGGEKSKSSYRAPPDLFRFGGDDGEWGRDMMFNADSHLRSRSEKIVELKTTARRNPALTLATPKDHSVSLYDTNSSQITPPIHALPQPNPPRRSSSLAASPCPPTATYEKRSSKLGRPPAAPSASYNNALPRSVSASAVSPEKDKESKRSRITSKIFGIGFGNSTTNSPPTIAYDQSLTYADLKDRKTRHMSVDLANFDRESTSATPPPISRYRASAGGPPPRETVERKRPSTRDGDQMITPQKQRGGTRDGGSASGERNWVLGGMEGYGLGLDGSAETRDRDVNGKKHAQAQAQTQTSGRKWFGLGRTGSLKR